MREDRFDAETDAALSGGKCGRESLLAGEMDNVAGSARVFQEGGETMGAFGFDRFRAARLVKLRARFAFGEVLLLKAGDEFGIFAMRGDDDAEFFRQRKGLEHLSIIDAEEVLVGQEDFEGGRAVGDNFTELRFGVVDEFGDRHVEGVIAGGMAGGFGLPEVIALERVVLAIGTAHLDVGVVPPMIAAMLAVSWVSLANVAMKGR